ncbi:hypothetical protein FJY90_07255 [Candidatus Gottesmanbacteria bacterium]|nr:hypothetical protein [Candidatus Gottesmanbacteria bacterium]
MVNIFEELSRRLHDFKNARHRSLEQEREIDAFRARWTHMETTLESYCRAIRNTVLNEVIVADAVNIYLLLANIHEIAGGMLTVKDAAEEFPAATLLLNGDIKYNGIGLEIDEITARAMWSNFGRRRIGLTEGGTSLAEYNPASPAPDNWLDANVKQQIPFPVTIPDHQLFLIIGTKGQQEVTGCLFFSDRPVEYPAQIDSAIFSIGPEPKAIPDRPVLPPPKRCSILDVHTGALTPIQS